MTWRRRLPSISRGRSLRNAARSAASNCLVGANCQRIGPSLSRKSRRPLAKNRAIYGAADANSMRWVRKRAPFLEAGRGLDAVEGAVDLDRADVPAGIGQLFRLAQARRVEGAARRRVDPAADADPYGAGVLHRSHCAFPAKAGTHSAMDTGFRRYDNRVWRSVDLA